MKHVALAIACVLSLVFDLAAEDATKIPPNDEPVPTYATPKRLSDRGAPASAPPVADPVRYAEVGTANGATRSYRLNDPWQVRFKIIVADVEPEHWAEVERVVGKVEKLAKRPKIDDATIEALKAKSLINVITRPMLGTNDGGIVTMLFGRRDLGLTDNDGELYDLKLSGKRGASGINTQIEWTIHHDYPHAVRRSVGADVVLRPNEFVAIAMPPFHDESDGSEPSPGKILFVCAMRGADSQAVKFQHMRTNGNHPPLKR